MSSTAADTLTEGRDNILAIATVFEEASRETDDYAPTERAELRAVFEGLQGLAARVGHALEMVEMRERELGAMSAVFFVFFASDVIDLARQPDGSYAIETEEREEREDDTESQGAEA